MEHKIGKIINFPNGRKAKVVEYDKLCDKCIFDGINCAVLKQFEYIGACYPSLRSDEKHIIYKEIYED